MSTRELRHRYLGGKTRMLDKIMGLIGQLVPKPGRVLDAFAGMGAVSEALRTAGHRVVATDQLECCRLVTGRLLAYDRVPSFTRFPVTPGYGPAGQPMQRLRAVVKCLHDWAQPVHGIFSETYSLAGKARRNYLTITNARRLDGIVHTLLAWRQQGVISAPELDWLMSELLCAVDRVLNTGPTQEKPLAQADPSARQLLALDMPPAGLYPKRAPIGEAYREDAAAVAARLGTFDLAYLDPPYGQPRQYSATFHVSEAVAHMGATLVGRTLTPVGGKIPVEDRARSGWSSGSQPVVIEAANGLFGAVDAQHLVMSYSSGSVLDWDTLQALLRQAWGARAVRRRTFRRKSNAAVRSAQKTVQEWLIHAQR